MQCFYSHRVHAHQICQTHSRRAATSARGSNGPAKKHLKSFPPLIVQSHLDNFDGGIEIADHTLDGGMKTEGGAHQIKERWRMAQLNALKVPALLKLAAI